ncbi:MAG: Pyruvate dehydrogenase E1 component like, partial [uncultured Microvirga sp.]
QPYRAALRRGAGASRPRHRARRPPGDAVLARLRHGPPHPLARRRAFWADRDRRRPLPPFRHRRPGHRGGGGDDRARPAGAAPSGAL